MKNVVKIGLDWGMTASVTDEKGPGGFFQLTCKTDNEKVVLGSLIKADLRAISDAIEAFLK